MQPLSLTVEHREERVLGVLVERVHHATPVLVDLGSHAVVVVPTGTVAGLHAVARVRPHLHDITGALSGFNTMVAWRQY